MAGLDPATQRDAKMRADEIGALPVGPRVKPGDDGACSRGQFHSSTAQAWPRLIEDCAFVVLPRLTGHSPPLLDGLMQRWVRR